MKTTTVHVFGRLGLALCLAVTLAGASGRPARAASIVVMNPSNDLPVTNR